jgi:Family of unknown function (DUF6998)
MKIKNAIKKLVKITSDLHKNHKSKKFTLDGRLVGDLGEVLAEGNYKITLFDKLEKDYDATSNDKKKIQIKTTFKHQLTFPSNHVPELFLGLKINSDGTFEEIYNGPGKYLKQLVKNRKKPYNRLHILSIKKMKAISETIPKKETIKRRLT